LNALYPSFKDQLLTKQFSWLGDTLAVALYDVLAIYVPTDSNISEIAGTQIAPGDPIANKTVVDGYAGSFPSVYTGLLNPLEVATAIIYRVSDGALVAYLDTTLDVVYLSFLNPTLSLLYLLAVQALLLVKSHLHLEHMHNSLHHLNTTPLRDMQSISHKTLHCLIH